MIAFVATPAHAVTPKDSLGDVYMYNPTIAAERARADEVSIQIDIAKADRRFDFRLQARAERAVERYGPFERVDYTGSTSLRASITLFSGERNSALVSEREAGAAASQADFEEVQNSVLSQAADAHISVVRDQEILRLQRAQSSVLYDFLSGAMARAKLGDLTRTDVDQSRARLAVSDARAAQAEATLVGSMQSYWMLTGKLATAGMNLDDDIQLLPASSVAMLQLSGAPAIKAAESRIAQAAAQVRSDRALRRPTVTGFAQYDSRVFGQDGFTPTRRNNAYIGISFRLPLYQGGAVSARVRAARAEESMMIERRTAAERSLRARVLAQYARLQAEDEAVIQGKLAVTAATLAKTVIIAQNAVGERSFLDLLNAQQELLEAQRRVIEARSNRISVAYQILADLGRLDDVAREWRERPVQPTASADDAVTKEIAGVTFVRDLPKWDLRHYAARKTDARRERQFL